MNEISRDQGFPVRVLATTFLAHLSISIAMGSIGPLAPFLQADLGISRAQIGLLTSVHSLGWIVMALVAGAMVEHSGVRRWIFLCPAATGIFALAFSRVSSFSQGIFVFLLLGILFSFVNPATTKAIIQSFPVIRRGTAIAIKQTGTPAGVFLASASLPAIALLSGWKTGMVAVGAANLAAGAAAWILHGGESPPKKSAIRRATLRGDLSCLFHNQDFLLISFLQGIFNVSQFVIQSYMVLFLIESSGYSAVYAGFVMATTQVFGIAGRISWGMISDFAYAGKRLPILKIAGLATALGLFGLALTGRSTPAWAVLLAASVAGAGSIGFGGTAMLLRAELAGRGLAATSTSVGSAIGAWGAVLGPPLFGLAVDVTGSYRIAWGILAGISLAASLALGLIREQKAGGAAARTQPGP